MSLQTSLDANGTGPGCADGRTRYRAGLLLLAALAAGCQGSGPAAPTGRPVAPDGEPFEVTGVITDQAGAPVAGAEVTMSHWLGGTVRRPAVRTEGSGGYTIAFTSNPWGSGTSRGAARAEVLADGYEWYWRTVPATAPRTVENFSLHRIKRITAGDSILVSATPDNGECIGWLSGPCGRLRVVAQVNGNLTVEAVPIQAPAGLPELEVCCASGSERYGNPVSLPVNAGSEVTVEIGQQRPGFTSSLSFMVKTSFEPF